MEDDLRIIVGLGLALLLVMLRLDAERFGAAEYDEPGPGRRSSLLWRLVWYSIGIGGIVGLVLVHPEPERDLFLTVGDRAGVPLALILGGAGVVQAIVLAWLHYHRLRLPDVASYPGGLFNEIATAFIDEAVFRGAVMGYFLWVGADANLAILGQAVMYVLATRLGAPGRDRYMFLLAVLIALVGGWATMLTGGIGASFFGHAVTRVAVFLTTGHPGQPAALGTDVEEVERQRRMPDGWRVVDRTGSRER